jgi:hypothetical protein
MNSAYAQNSQPRVPTRVCQGRVVTTNLPTLGTNPNSKQHGSTTQEAKDLGDLYSLGRTVCEHRADRLKMPPDLPVLHLEKWTIHALPVDHPRVTRTARTVHDEQADYPQMLCNQSQLPRRIEPQTG